MKSKDEPSANLWRGDHSTSVQLNLPADGSDETADPPSRQGDAATAHAEQPALSQLQTSLMAAVVDESNLEHAGKKVKANRGAPGPDGMTLAAFPAWFREHWPEIQQQLVEGTYRPAPVRRKTIAKPAGGERQLGIPNVLDRLIQQAIVQVLTPIFDLHFSDQSFGFRPGRSAHGATQQVQRHLRQGYRYVADMDLSKFFDRAARCPHGTSRSPRR